MRWFLAIGLMICGASPLMAATSEPAGASGVESLGNELLDDLNPNILHQPLGPAADDQSDGQTAPGGPAGRVPRYDDLGEDIGQPSGPLSLARVRQGMQHAETLLGAKEPINGNSLQQAGAAQAEVVNQLDKLIAELSKQCQGGQCKPSDGPPKPSQRSQPKPGNSSKAAGRGQTAARDSTTRLGQADSRSVEKADIDAMVKNLWGHLPERSREQMLQSFSEEFLPQYQLDIEQYYRRLSEEQEEGQPQP